MIIFENPLKTKYKFLKFDINSETIKEFELMARARMVRKSKVHELKRMIASGDHFDSPIIINDTSTKKRIIDGQHRLSAIRELIEEHKEFSISVLLIAYKDLSHSEEKEIFTKWNSGSRQTSDDFLQIYTDDIPIFGWLNEKGIISIYHEKGKIKFKNLVQPYIQAKANNIHESVALSTFIDEAKKLKKEDLEKIIEFYKEFKENISEDSQFNKWSGFAGLSFVYYTNQKRDFWKVFHEKVEKNPKIKDLSMASGREIVYLIKCIIEEKMFGKKANMPSKEIKHHFKNPFKIWDDEKIEWLRKNYEKTMFTAKDLIEKFFGEFRIEVSEGSIKEKLVSNKIRKDPEYRKKMMEEESYSGRTRIYTKKLLEFARKCSMTMTVQETFEKCKVESEQPLNYNSFKQRMCNEGITFVKKDELLGKCDSKTLKIIKKYKNLPAYEIRDKLIEETGKGMKNYDIGRIIKRIEANQEEEIIKKDIQKDFEEFGKEDKLDEEIESNPEDDLYLEDE